jgi:hypothetical protein
MPLPNLVGLVPSARREGLHGTSASARAWGKVSATLPMGDDVVPNRAIPGLRPRNFGCIQLESMVSQYKKSRPPIQSVSIARENYTSKIE